MDKMEAKLARFINHDTPIDDPDFEAMWSRLESQLPEPGTALIPVPPEGKKRRALRKAAAIGALAALLAAAPVVAAVANRWDAILSYREGVSSALEQGLGQSIEQSVTRENVTVTVHTAVVDDNRTALLFSMKTRDKTPEEGLFFDIEQVELKDAVGQPVEGWKQLNWDPAAGIWRGYFETNWTPDTPSANVSLTFRNIQGISPMERTLPLHPMAEETQTFHILQDGIGQLSVKPILQSDKLLFTSTIVFSQPEAQKWTFPHIGVFHGGASVREAGQGVMGRPDENGNYTAQQSFQISDLQQDQVSYKLLYNKEAKRINADWTFDLQLNKQQMESGTIRRDLNIPLQHQGKQMVLNQMIITPTQVRIKASHDKFAVFPFMNYSLLVDGTVLRGGIADSHTNPEETVFRFEVPPGVRINEHSSITFAAKHERLEHTDAKAPIPLRQISEEKKTITTQVGGYSVLWTYYRKDGNLYVQSESGDPGFGGVNQTHILNGEMRAAGQKMTVNFGGDGNNQAMDMYPNYTGTDADLYIFWYYTEKPEQELSAVIAP